MESITNRVRGVKERYKNVVKDTYNDFKTGKLLEKDRAIVEILEKYDEFKASYKIIRENAMNMFDALRETFISTPNLTKIYKDSRFDTFDCKRLIDELDLFLVSSEETYKKFIDNKLSEIFTAYDKLIEEVDEILKVGDIKSNSKRCLKELGKSILYRSSSDEDVRIPSDLREKIAAIYENKDEILKKLMEDVVNTLYTYHRLICGNLEHYRNNLKDRGIANLSEFELLVD